MKINEIRQKIKDANKAYEEANSQLVNAVKETQKTRDGLSKIPINNFTNVEISEGGILVKIIQSIDIEEEREITIRDEEIPILIKILQSLV